MPPDGYTTITIPEETAEKLTQLVIQHELETMSEAVESAVDSTLTTESLSDAELAQLLYQRLRSPDTTLFGRLAEPEALVPLAGQKRICMKTALPSARD